MRSINRIRPILDVIEEIWLMFPDMRLGQLLLNSDISYHTEDVNELIVNLCSVYSLPAEKYLLWGTYGPLGNKELEYRRLNLLETEHLEAILKDNEEATISFLPNYLLESINKLLGMKNITKS